MRLVLQSRSRLQPWKHYCNKPSSSQLNPMLFAVCLLLASLDVIKSQFLVKTLPGLDGDLPFTLETGYIGVGESDDEQLFYYFIESEGNPKDDPLMIWLTGGPGCSSLSGLMFEIGPFTINYAISTLENPILEVVPYSWTKVANIIFLDQPAGSGFSYAKTPETYITNDTLSSKLAYSFLRKWLVDHPKFLSNPLYVGGTSYSGKIVPQIVQAIYDGNEIGEEPLLNIKGYTLGNPFTDTSGDYNTKLPFAHDMALLSDAIYKSAKENCGGEYLNVDPDNSLCIHALQTVDKCLERINTAQILEPLCDTSNNLKSDLSRRDLRGLDKTSLDTWSILQVQKHWCQDDKDEYTAAWANRKDVREALHIHEEFYNIKWVRCNESLTHDFFKETPSYAHNVRSVVDYHRHFTDKKCRALVFSGDHDMIVPHLGTLNWIQSLNLPVVDDWRAWFVDEQVAGYTMKYVNGTDYSLIFATVKGGGHTAAEFKPKECLNMFTRWLANDTL
uniref:serine carboxypeptidase-like 10 n=1 Tax=Erigeron canadensis TaxID=72917 RepID=UPI001CB97562|nr:serine carboxypeptidase-like 10 [Erigeron canadensis]XP_043624836.1 serine carboxypeptidase-like 10 [Erigeron canadensis]